MKEWLKDYFSFTRKERVGVIVLVSLIIVFFLLPDFFPAHFKQPSKAELAQLKLEASQLNSLKRDSPVTVESGNYREMPAYNYQKKNVGSDFRGKLFYFDPNTISPAQWRELGLRDKTIETIQKYLARGGQFRHPDDIRKIYGLRADEAERLAAYVVIKPAAGENSKKTDTSRNKIFAVSMAKRDPQKLDINLSDTAAWIALPGIGNKLATRIINFREKLGGFSSVDQIGETFGLADSVFQKIRGYLFVSNGQVHKININMATAEEMKNHPYLRGNIANAIVQYRNQHGTFRQPEDLKQIALIDEKTLQKILPYIAVN